MKSKTPNRDFEQVVLPHLGAAQALARWLVRDSALAEDVVQDAVTRAWKYFASFRAGGSGKAWFLQIVRRTAYSCIRARRRYTECSLSALAEQEEERTAPELPDPRPGPEAAAAQRQELGALDEALNALPPAQRECIVLREVEMLSYKRIARLTDVPIGTVMSRIARGRRALRIAAQGARGAEPAALAS